MAGRNQNPSGDGDMTLYTPNSEKYGRYIHPDVNRRAGRTTGNWRIIYVNGMATTARVHQETSRQLATIAGKNVSGIYNQQGTDGTSGFLADLAQCAEDQTLRVGRSIPEGRRWMLTGTETQRAEAIGQRLLRNNLAAQTLFGELFGAAKAGAWTIVVCHSQGNLITTNALWVLKHIRQNAPTHMGKIRVFGLASPSASWPPNRQGGLHFRLYRHSGDPVTLLSLPWIGEAAATVETPSRTLRVGSAEWEASGLMSMDFHAVTGNYFTRRDFQADLHHTLRGG